MIIDSNRSSQILASMIYEIRASDPPPGLSHKGTWLWALRGDSGGTHRWKTQLKTQCSHWGVLDSFRGVMGGMNYHYPMNYRKTVRTCPECSNFWIRQAAKSCPNAPGRTDG